MSTTTKMKPIGKVLIGLIIIGVIIGTLKVSGKLDGLIKESVMINTVDLPTAPENAKTAGLTFAGLPSTSPISKSLPKVTIQIMAWNSQLGLMFANGGPQTTEGSLMEKNGVNLTILRQDNINQSGQDLIKFATEYKKNPSTASGPQFFAMMGDGSAATLATINKELRKLGDDFIAQVVFSCGRSNGEDALMSPVSWRENPQNAKGGVVATVIRDGDWNIVVKWASDNNIKINPDEKTYDPEAINFINVADNVEGGEKYITGYKETRPIVKDGKKTGETIEIQANAVSVWTPVDVSVAEKKGGLIRLVSTKEYSAQMPNVVIGIKKWMENNSTVVENMITAVTQGGDQVKSFSSALNKAGDISALVYKEQNGEYWVKYAKGVTQSDKQGLQVELGGSVQFNLADNLNTFGISPNSTNTYEIIYNTFGGIGKDLYPELFPDFDKVEDILNLSFLRNVMNKQGSNITSGATEKYTSNGTSQVVAERSYTIEFGINSANLTPAGEKTLQKIYESLIVANGLNVEVNGYTDATGNEDLNRSLSQSRADAIKGWLQMKSSINFPDERVKTQGFGSANPVASNFTEYGRAKNRRVSILMTK